MAEFADSLQNIPRSYISVFLAVMRFVAPVLISLLLWRCGKSLLAFRREPEVWAWLVPQRGQKIEINHWENVIGRNKASDIVLNADTVSRTHAVLTRYDDGSWSITDVDSKNGVTVNGRKVTGAVLHNGNVIGIGDQEFTLQIVSRKQGAKLDKLRHKAADWLDSVCNLLILSVFQGAACIAFLMDGVGAHTATVLSAFAGLVLLQWLLLGLYLALRRPAFEMETIAFFLCTMGMAALAAVKPGECLKQLLAVALGVAGFLLVALSVRKLKWAMYIRYVAAGLGILLLIVTLLFGEEYYGAKNWLQLGPMSLQPSELAKVCFVYTGASTMDKLLQKRNILFFIIYTLVICGCLALMNDFGTAMVFFAAFLVIAFLRSGSVGTVGLAVTALGFAGVVALKIAPHAMRRFAAWRHIWENPLTSGYQQTQALMCLASGGLFGLGIGQGRMAGLFAADSDVVFATVSEEWGLIVALLTVLAVMIPALFAVRCASISRSSFYTIGACTAGAVLVVQTMFNVLGTLDILPMTGVTMPFVSNGGSSMICVWALLAFIKAADTRRNASFAVRSGKQRGRGE